VEVRCGENILIFDCGSGVRKLGLSLVKEAEGRPLNLHLFVSHTHWDHIQGFPFFVPAYLPTSQITIYSLHGADKSLEKLFTGQMDASYFPVALSDLQSQLRFVELRSDVILGETKISHFFLNHPGLAVAFRIEYGSKSVVYLTDHEPYWRLTGDNEHNRKRDREVDEFARGADLYIREAQYTEEEYPTKRAWGHSTWKDAVLSAHAAGVRQMALYHHDPMHDDGILDEILARCHALMAEQGMTFRCLAASDGLEIRP
jgi:phosphoribosyl 1,2-cyclic phosphodiesterase